ncbi:MAG: hypothetical protein IH987_04240 [Planctomycetes bacterium]|nr:hypothetical protein [Planctomycetota bacterium]
MKKYHLLAAGVLPTGPPDKILPISAKALANRFLAAQQANWRNRKKTLTVYRDWLGRFLKDHRGLNACEYTVEMFAAWKISLRERKYTPESINHYLSAVRAMYAFGEDVDLIPKAPRLRRVRNESRMGLTNRSKTIYSKLDAKNLFSCADTQFRAMILLALNAGFGPKDIHDLKWHDLRGNRVALSRSKTGVHQSYQLWPETAQALGGLRQSRTALIKRLVRRGRIRTDRGHVFVTRYWDPWLSDAVSREFRKLCKKAGVPC